MSDKMTPGPGAYGAPGQDSASAWYRAAPARPAPPPPLSAGGPSPQPDRRRRKRTKIISLSVCGALLCAALVVAVWQGDLARRLRDLSAARAYRYGDSFGYDFGAGAEDEQTPADDYEDYRDYFANYYTGSNEIDLPAADIGTGVTLDLRAQQGDELSMQEIYDRVSPAVVGITTYLDGEEYSWGTGVVFTADGYIITNTHILQGCNGAQIMFPDGRSFDAQLVGADEASDIAVLRIEDGESLPFAEFGRSASLHVGDEVVAIGNPLGKDYTGTMTNGIISAIDRNVTYEGHTMTLLQTNAALNEGNSGGPLINAQGQVIGITNMKIMSSYFTTVEGIGFAIPSSVVKQIADQLIETGLVPGNPTIGIVAGPVGTEAMMLYELPEGLYVTEVSEGSDALEKGLRAGDVITAVNGEHVTSVAQVNEIKDGMEVGDVVTVSVYRDGERLELEIALVDKADIK